MLKPVCLVAPCLIYANDCTCALQDAAYGGWEGVRTNIEGVLHSHDGKLWVNLPGQTTLVFTQEA